MNKNNTSSDKLESKGQTCWVIAAFSCLNRILSSESEWVIPRASPSSQVQKDQRTISYWGVFDPKKRKSWVGVLQVAAQQQQNFSDISLLNNMVRTCPS